MIMYDNVYDNSTTKVPILHFKYHFHQNKMSPCFKTRRLNVIGNVAIKLYSNKLSIKNKFYIIEIDMLCFDLKL